MEEAVDMFEIVSVDNQVWDILYFHIYHPRLSNNLPTNFTVKDDELFSKIAVGLGTCSFIDNFLNGVSNVLNEKYKYGIDFNSIAQKYLNLYTFIRPQEHIIKLLLANNIGSYFDKLIHSTSTEYGINYFINFLVSPIPQAHIYALKALANQNDYSDELFKSLGNFCLKVKDPTYTNLVIDIIEKVKPDDHKYYGAWIKMLDIAPMADAVRNMIAAAFIKEEDFLPSSIPYLIMTANHPNANRNLINFCSQIVDEITYR